MARDLGIQTVFVNDRATERCLHKAKLLVIDGPQVGQEFIVEKSVTSLGRARVNDIQLQDASVSSVHLEIHAKEQGFLIKDLDSTNGTTLQGCRVREVFIEPDVPFMVGNTTLKLKGVDETVSIALSKDEQFSGVIGRAVAMREVFATLAKVAPTELTVLIEGDTGTGKERVARAIHDASRRKSKPYAVLDCSSIPKDLMESYVFGHEKGSFTGAVAQREGAFESANGGTLFLDEIGELDLSLQPKLLRVLENQEIKRVGSNKTIKIDCRVIAATNRSLREMVANGTFREDLYFRLSIINLRLPTLSQRREDIPLLVNHFASSFSSGSTARFTADALDALMSYAWPGNVRELKNVVARSVSLCTDGVVERTDLHLRGYNPAPEVDSSPLTQPITLPGEVGAIDLDVEFKDAKQDLMDDFEVAYLTALMEAHHDNISQASRAAGITRYYLRELLKKHGLK